MNNAPDLESTLGIIILSTSDFSIYSKCYQGDFDPLMWKGQGLDHFLSLTSNFYVTVFIIVLVEGPTQTSNVKNAPMGVMSMQATSLGILFVPTSWTSPSSFISRYTHCPWPPARNTYNHKKNKYQFTYSKYILCMQ